MDSSSSATDKHSLPVHQVVIVGAGISGLSAARYLLKHGITDFIILEATSKPGGRIHTKSFGKGLIELGAQWIHGEQNELCQLIKASNHRNIKTSWEGKGDFLCADGSKVDNALVDEVLGWLEDIIETVESTFSIETLQESENGHGSGHTASMGKYLLENFHCYLKERHPALDETSPEYQLRLALFQWGMSFQRIDNSCNRMNDLSLYRWSEFEVNPGEHYNNFARGAQSLVDEVLVGRGEDSLQTRVIYNRPVTNIKWGSEKHHAKVETEDGSVYLGKVVLVTVSVGVLKSNLESLFTPKLPKKLANAIQSTGFGPVTKLFLEWAEPWWPLDLKGFQLVWPQSFLNCCEGSSQNEKMDDIWHKSITGFDPVLSNPNVLLGWLGGPEAVYAETLSEEKIKTRCVQILRDFTGYDVPPAEKAIVSKWNSNKFVQGAYSFRSVDGDSIKGDICAILNEPIFVEDEFGQAKPVIILAGEALSKTHYSTLHGAYESGMAQATKIVQYFSSTLHSSSSKNVAKDVSRNGLLDACNDNDLGKVSNNKTNFHVSSVLAANKDIEVPS